MSAGPLIDIPASSTAPFTGILPSSLFPLLASTLLGLGFMIASYFLMYEVGATKYNRSVVKEISIAVPASVLLGFGTLFTFLAIGIYV
ncbi:UPF0197 transmembrane protein C11orf10 [Paraphysoderma sedebokerense]|nr:UPF0197 transmembrane protein C11orf10 [Paraphysoderma sedebokerense]